MNCSDLLETSESARFVQWNNNTLNTPFKAGLTDCQEGFAFCYGNWNGYMTVIAFAKNSNKMWAWSKLSGNWVEYVTKSDLTNAIVFRGVFTGDLNKASSGGIDAGYYTIRAADTVSNAPDGAAWCTFVQFSGDYHTQLIVQPNFLAVRRYAGSPVQWTGWSKYKES